MLGAMLAGLALARPAAAGEVESAVDAAETEVGADAEVTADAELAAEAEEPPDWDPWQPFNEWTFSFNHRVLDRFLVKPLAQAWDLVMPDPVQRGLANMFENLEMPRRTINHMLQARPRRAGDEIARFLLNTTAGIGGFFDVAKRLGIEGSYADSGQTLGVWGVGPGPFLVLPLLPPMTVRDGIGRGIDGAMDPVGYIAIPLAVAVPITVVQQVNERSLHLAAFENIEDAVIDLYSAVRNAYLQRRRVSIQPRRQDWHALWCGPESGPEPAPTTAAP